MVQVDVRRSTPVGRLADLALEQEQQRLPVRDGRVDRHGQRGDRPGGRGDDDLLHLHRLEYDQRRSGDHLVPGRDVDRDDGAGEGAATAVLPAGASSTAEGVDAARARAVGVDPRRRRDDGLGVGLGLAPSSSSRCRSRKSVPISPGTYRGDVQERAEEPDVRRRRRPPATSRSALGVAAEPPGVASPLRSPSVLAISFASSESKRGDTCQPA